MNTLSKYKDFIFELVQPDFFEKNPGFYLTDIRDKNINKKEQKQEKDNVKELFQDVEVNDIYFERKRRYYTSYILHFKKEYLDNEYIKLCGKQGRGYKRLYFYKNEYENNWFFGKEVGHRFHIDFGLPSKMQNIGIGLKIYKAFLKHVGYIVSNYNINGKVSSIYYQLLQDPDYYHIIDLDDRDDKDKIMIIDKKYEHIDELLKIIRKKENEENREYIYDKELQRYV